MDDAAGHGRQDGDRTGLSVPDAAQRLGVTPDAVRARLHRGTLAGEKRDGPWVVFPPDADEPAPSAHEPTGPRADPTVGQQDADRTATAALIATLERENARLWEALAARTEEVRRKDHIIAGLVQRVPGLPAGTDAARARQDAPHEAEPAAHGSELALVAALAAVAGRRGRVTAP